MTILTDRCHVLLLAIAGFALAGSAQAEQVDAMSQKICREVLPHIAKTLSGVLEPIPRRDSAWTLTATSPPGSAIGSHA